jgi:hypothetical protein
MAIKGSTNGLQNTKESKRRASTATEAHSDREQSTLKQRLIEIETVEF